MLSPNLARNPALPADLTPWLAVNAPCQVMGYSFINPNTYPVYVKFYDAKTGVVVGTTIPRLTRAVPVNGAIVQDNNDNGQGMFDLGVTLVVTKNLPDSDTTAVDDTVYAEVFYT